MTPVRELFPMLLEAELTMFVCSACVKKYNTPEDEIVVALQSHPADCNRRYDGQGNHNVLRQ